MIPGEPDLGLENYDINSEIPPAKRKFSLFWPFFLVILISACFWLISIPVAGCDTPLDFAIGEIDQRFKINEEDLISNSEAAAKRWNDGKGRQILRYNQKAGLRINMVYDERQARIDTVNQKLAGINQSENSIGGWRESLNLLVSQYEKNIQEYNDKIDYWNTRSDMPADVYSSLQNERLNLEQDRDNINQSAELLNVRINNYNSNLTEFKNELGREQGRVETEGEFSALTNEINIFTFENKDELGLVLTHEFGHVLGIDHAANEKSIMYYLLSGKDIKNTQLSDEDLNMLANECKPNKKLLRSAVQLVRKYSI